MCVSVMVRQRRGESSEEEMKRVVTMTRRCGKRKLVDVGSEAREANWQYKGRE